MKFLFFLAMIFSSLLPLAQGLENPLLQKITSGYNVPEALLASRSFVIYSSEYTSEQLKEIQSAFQKTGIDAVGYFLTDLVFASKDVTEKVAAYLKKREINFLVLLNKRDDQFSLSFTNFSGDETFVSENQTAWTVNHSDLNEALLTIYRTAINNQPRRNLLINDYPETSFEIKLIDGRRSDFFAIDLKVDNLAVPWFGEPRMDSTLHQYFKDTYPYKYSMTDKKMSTDELQKNGFHYVLNHVYTQGSIAKDLLGYESSNESAITSITYPNGSERLKTIPANTIVYKFYFKHIRSGNVFLGTKWDADVEWSDALRNHVKGFKAELKIP